MTPLSPGFSTATCFVDAGKEKKMNHLLLRRLWASSSGISSTTTHYWPVTLSKVISVKAASRGSGGTSGCVQDMIQKWKKNM